MNREEIIKILSVCDHTNLAVDARLEDIYAVCDDAIRYGCASVCIPPSYVKAASEYVHGRMPICTVVGFPNGYSATEVKVTETQRAIADGADEIDCVINVGYLKDKRYEEISAELSAIRRACQGYILKVIIETALLSEEEIIKMTELVSESGADFIKTSTGFSTRGASFRDIELFAAHRAEKLKIKAAGGIASLEDARKMMALGADRLGTSKIVKIVKSEGLI